MSAFVRPSRRRLALAATFVAALPVAGYLAAPAAAGQGAGAPGSHLAGFNTNAVSAGAQIELLLPGLVPLGDVTKGNFVQASVPYAASSASTGPQNGGVASPMWPGDSAATAGNAIQTFEPSFPPALVKLLNYPVVARSAFPGQVNAQPSATFNPSGPAGIGTATTSSAAGGSQSSAVISNLSPLGVAKSTKTPLFQIGSVTSSSSSSVGVASVSTTADTHIGKVTIAGLITIDGIDTTAVASSNGKHGSKTTSIKIGHVTVAGLDASIGPKGITLNKKGLLGQLGVVAIANKALAALKKVGISIRTVAPTSKVHGKVATATSGAVLVEFKDANLPDIGKLLPQAPVPLPSSVGFTVSLGLSDVSAAATLLPQFSQPSTPPTTPPASTPASASQPNTSVPSTGGGDFTNPPPGPGATTAPVPAGSPVVAVPQTATAFGLPVRTAWVVMSFLLALLLAGLMLSYANWQLLRGRSP